MNWKEFQDNATTLLLACVPLALLLISYFYAYIPPEYIALVTIFLAFLSQYTSNQRVKDSVEIVKKWIRWDYITTILLAVWPLIVTFQPQILVYVPPALLGFVTVIFTIICCE
jgi:membrane glycosyltransferase